MVVWVFLEGLGFGFCFVILWVCLGVKLWEVGWVILGRLKVLELVGMVRR